MRACLCSLRLLGDEENPQHDQQDRPVVVDGTGHPGKTRPGGNSGQDQQYADNPAPAVLLTGENQQEGGADDDEQDRKSTRLNSSHVKISYAVFCLKKKKNRRRDKDKRETKKKKNS